eukprot:5247910-Prymnesium_polylepis.1
MSSVGAGRRSSDMRGRGGVRDMRTISKIGPVRPSSSTMLRPDPPQNQRWRGVRSDASDCSLAAPRFPDGMYRLDVVDTARDTHTLDEAKSSF